MADFADTASATDPFPPLNVPTNVMVPADPVISASDNTTFSRTVSPEALAASSSKRVPLRVNSPSDNEPSPANTPL